MSDAEFHAVDAVRGRTPASILLSGPSGCGKTYGALLLATALASGKAIVLIDTEVKPSSLYAKRFPHKRIALPKPFTPARYRAAIKAALALKPAVLIVDSVTHEWLGAGGILRELDEWKKTRGGEKAPMFLFWKDATPQHDRFVESLTTQQCHVIACCRGREKFVVEMKENDEGQKRATPRSVGLRPLQRKDFRYDFIFAFTLDPETHTARLITNGQGDIFQEWEPHALTPADAQAIAAWSNGATPSRKGKK